MTNDLIVYMCTKKNQLLLSLIIVHIVRIIMYIYLFIYCIYIHLFYYERYRLYIYIYYDDYIIMLSLGI